MNEDVVFYVFGPRVVHLTGFYPAVAPNFNDDELESFGEDIANSENEESVAQSDEDQYEDSVINDDDDLEVIQPSPVSSIDGGMSVVDDVDKKRNKKKTNRRLKKRSRIEESDDESISWKLNTGSCIRRAYVSDIEDNFPISFLHKNKKDAYNTVRNDPKR
ncbi:hypothetical protein POM88_017209 [Heracleum sosnowskyi]|uniref:Uncharacterized protein n=1 Tax=Heracleum sosnowskyi TaxID=360622 RepID=A0AAD8IP25_9APIA|nr:hypothetical protein POM88_017209 [Heracleum sosnowskyi]